MNLLKYVKIVAIILLGILFLKTDSISEAKSIDFWSKEIPSVQISNPQESVYSHRLSKLYPTGLYANQGDNIVVKGNNVTICLGPPGRDDYRSGDGVTRYAVSGETTIRINDKKTIIYIENVSGNNQVVSICLY
ncbi:hypothetical protein KUA55_12515 [Enterococcus sp. ALS3]|uniref:Uncharacterized protein n=1 Tax=Enterococcus alishanensis TaxID=1303817 RepID=A0ABS6TF21_9ENTE|nr:hypothetical protein [Enterococcus alishanensis]MBV7391505.1 hypothetical protein [Enterococcus alishanensis]